MLTKLRVVKTYCSRDDAIYIVVSGLKVAKLARSNEKMSQPVSVGVCRL